MSINRIGGFFIVNSDPLKEPVVRKLAYLFWFLAPMRTYVLCATRVQTTVLKTYLGKYKTDRRMWR